MYKLFVLCAMSLMLITTPQGVQAGVISVTDAVNDAGRQRMLTQRITKLYAMRVLRVSHDREQLDADIALFDKQLAELNAFATDAGLKAALATVSGLWTPFKVLASASANKEGIQALSSIDEALLKASHAVVLVLVKTGGVSGSDTVNVAGRQRMLSQQIAKDYMLQKLDINVSNVAAARDQFEAAMKILTAVAENTDEIKAALAKTQDAWDVAKSMFSIRVPVPEIVDGAMDEVLKEMNKTTTLYAALFSK